jgi:signal transduction histidine kinase
MSVSSTEIAVLLQALCYLMLAAIAARQFLREPGQLRFHTLLIFISAAAALLLAEASIRLSTVGSQDAAASFLLRISGIGGLLSVYAVFLLTADLTPLRHWPGWLGLGIFILGGGFTLVAPHNLAGSSFVLLGVPVPFLPLAILLLLLGSCLLISLCLWYGSALASGAMRRRLQWLGGVTTLACCGITLLLALPFVPRSQVTLIWIACLLLLVLGIVFYLGCAPPGWLRRFWMLPELERASRFCTAAMLHQPEPAAGADTRRQNAAICQLLQYTMNGFGALVGIVQLWNEASDTLEVAASIIPSEEGFAADAKSTKDEALAAVFSSRQALLRPISARKWPFLQRTLDSGMVMAAPLVRGEETLGVIGLCCEHVPGLNARDLARLQLFADQITCLIVCHMQQEQAAALKALRSEQMLKDEFIALIAHDLRTPLTVLKGRLQLLRRQLLKEGQAAAAETVSRLDMPYNRLSQLISTLLDVSYIDTGRLQLLRHAVDLTGLVRKVVQAHAEREIVLEVVGASSQQEGTEAASAEPIIALADAGRLEQVLGNLLDNASKYSPVDSKIIVRLERRAGTQAAGESAETGFPQAAEPRERAAGETAEAQPRQAPIAAGGEEALISVSDQGIGIPLEDQPRLFERWFRGANSPSQNYTGLGLGLYISHEIITRHGGRLWVESSGVPSEGSTFFFTLPLLRPQQVTEAAGSETA